jgi:hypothetical protein
MMAFAWLIIWSCRLKIDQRFGGSSGLNLLQANAIMKKVSGRSYVDLLLAED